MKSNKPILLKATHSIYIAIAAILSVTVGCHSPKNKTATTEDSIAPDSSLIQINIDPNGGESYPFDSLIDDISFIKLETNDDCVIGDIHQVLCTDNYIFILDLFSTNAVYCFDKQGNFIRKIGKKGQGPGEYFRLCKMTLNSDKTQIILFDWTRLHYYDLQGKHIKDVQPKRGGNDIELSDNDFLAAFRESGVDDGPQREMLAVYDKDFNLQYKKFPSFYNEYFKMNNGMHPLRNYANGIYLKEPWTHSIYKIEKEQCYEKYRINIVDGGYPERPEDMDSDTFMDLYRNRFTLSDYVILKDYALFYYSKDGPSWSPFVIYSHKTKRTYRYNGVSHNPLSFANSVGSTAPAVYDDETFIIHQTAIQIMYMKQYIYNSPLINNSKLERLYDGLNEESNPVLFLLHIKQETFN